MYNKTKKNRIIHLLSHHNIRFIDIPFHIKPYINLLKRCPALISPRLPASVLLSFRNQLTQFNHLIANNNGARNTVLEYGRRLGYEWTFYWIPIVSLMILYTNLQYFPGLEFVASVHLYPKSGYRIKVGQSRDVQKIPYSYICRNGNHNWPFPHIHTRNLRRRKVTVR